MLDRQSWQAVVLALAMIGFAMGAIGCSDDLYAKCQPDEELGCDGAYSCVAEPDFQCSTRICAQYQDKGAAFCTQRCEADGDCAGGECRNVVLGTPTKYCVPSDRLE